AHRGLGIGGGGDGGRHRVLLHVVVARRDVDADVARGTVEGRTGDAGAVGHALVDGGVARAVLVDEDLGVGKAEGEVGVGSGQRRGVVLHVVVAGGDVELQVARSARGGVITGRRVVGQHVVQSDVGGVGLAVVDHRDRRRIQLDVAADGGLAAEGDVRAQRQRLVDLHAHAVLVTLAADVGAAVFVAHDVGADLVGLQVVRLVRRQRVALGEVSGVVDVLVDLGRVAQVLGQVRRVVEGVVDR